jgi:hypothetical protein
MTPTLPQEADLIATSDRPLELAVAVENFHDHVDGCDACHAEQTALCDEGNRLLKLADELRN